MLSAVRTFEGRADMLRAASGAYFSEYPREELQKAFKVLLSEAVSFSQRRNDVAHGVADIYLPLSEGPPIVKDIYALYPSYASFKGRSLGNFPEYSYTSAELNYFNDHFTRLAEQRSKLIEPCILPWRELLHTLPFLWR
jgi:hypothetical protein